MIPETMRRFLEDRLPERSWQNRLIREAERCYFEFGPLDVDQLARLGIEVDKLGPRLVVCMWDETPGLEVGGYLVVDNLAMGKPSMGGIRMLPDVTPAAIHNLARGMTLKNAAASLPYGGGKAGIIADPEAPAEVHTRIVRRFARLIARYNPIYLPGPDVGTNDADMKTIAVANGLDNALSKPADMGGNRIDELGAAAGGVVIALEALLEEMPRLRVLPQFAGLHIPDPEEITVLIQGFGAVGAHAARILHERMPGARVTGVSDLDGYLYAPDGLPVDHLFRIWQAGTLVTRAYYQEQLAELRYGAIRAKYGSSPDDLLRESAIALIPAAPIANYLDTDPDTQPCMTVDRMGRWSVIVEGANTYSPDPARKLARARMERAVYREKGVLIATDYLVNSGGVIYAAQEHLIKTPDSLRIPEALLGDAVAVEAWLQENAPAFSDLAQRRLEAARSYREEAIRRNMGELIDLLAADADMLPLEAAERISVRRIASRESDRTAVEIMEPMPTIASQSNVREAAQLLIETGSPILAVLSPNGELAGVLTEWDVTCATAHGSPDNTPLERVMTRKVIHARPEDTILSILRELELNEISAMPVVDGGEVLGMVSADLLARRSLLRLLQSQTD